MSERFASLMPRLKELAYLRSASAVLDWDQQVFMPPKGGPARGDLLAYLSVLAHGKATDAGFMRDIYALRDDPSGLDEEERAAVREMVRDLDRARAVPPEFVQEISELSSAAFQAWQRARPSSDFAAFEPYLEKMVDLKRREADYLGFADSPYDALLDCYEPGMTAASAAAMFAELREGISKILKCAPRTDGSVLRGDFPEERQRELYIAFLKQLGFDLEAGRLDTSAHPFSTSFHPRDQRITTRYDRNDLLGGLFGTIHEMGHALYEYGLPEEKFGTPLAEAASYGVHESQSRGWENLVGRSRPFWEYWHPRLAEAFPEPFGRLGLDATYAAINAVKPSLIRTESDELTYNLHIIVRFEIEKALIEGKLAVKDAPEAWNAAVREYLGIEVPDHAHGILQDVHWSGGMMGYFPSYALGNVYAAQLCAAQRRDIPGLEADIARGDFSSYRAWNLEHIHRHGRRFLPEELIERATGEKPSARFLLEHLEAKYATVGA